MIFKKERKAVAKTMRRLYKQGLTTSSGGNVSLKNEDGFVFITAGQTDKSCIKWQDIVVFDENKKNITPEIKPSMESGMHLKIYDTRKDVFAIVHSHPIFASSFAIAGSIPKTNLSGEARFILGEVSLAEYELMGTESLAKELADKLQNNDVCIMKNHGAISVGKTLFEAFDKIEVLEFTCHLNINSLILNKVNELNDKQIQEIDELKKHKS
ncbi:MAG: class II aldolase/adducin family protein [Bacteroidales bacterium]|jgi:L-fuculose-phosphate aldolase|nr:class II aldolase/adducin family protein [Bacteroidales bacterium]MCK9498300.1 class II aldolase/adducin family protein [Bacteroidales bacterium]MDY0314198.1 class II aldolase/adducin family protein [Bacteroidales bacterium]NLB86442.1 class II aldolase/adducin family protein [Bacteroidales bacterium]